MALVLVRLRLVISRRVRGTGNAAQLYLATSWVVGGVGGLLAGTMIAALVSGGGDGDLLVLAGFCSIFIPWVVGPIVEPTLADGIVDPQRLEQFPLTGWQQVSGLMAGALISPTATFTFLFAAGGTMALDEGYPTRLVAALTAIAYTVMCVAVSRSAQALLAGALRSRRGTDVAAVAASLLVLGSYLFAQQARAATEALGSPLATGPVGAVVGWIPPGAAGHAILDARDGDWVSFFARFTVVLATIALALLAWRWALSRRVDGVTSSTHARHQRPAVGAALPLTPDVLRGLPAGPTTAATAQQLRYFFFRSPRAIQTLIIPPVMGMVVAHSSFAPYGLAAQAAAFAAMSVVAGSFNLFGYDGPGFGYLLLGGAPLPRVLLGKAMAPLFYLVPLVVVFTIVEAMIRGTTGNLTTAILAGLAVVAVGVGVGSLSSVRNPSDQSRVGQRRGSFLKVFAWFMSFFAVVGVGGATWWILSWFVNESVTALVMLAVSIGLAWLMLRSAGARLGRDPYTVLEKLAPQMP